MEEKKKGGTRPGAGRKPLDDPKEQIALYVHKSAISKFGDKDGLKEALYGFIYGTTENEPKPLVFKKAAPKREKTTLSVDSGSKVQIEPPSDVYDTPRIPKTLDELKSFCPPELKGFDRSEWIATERKKYSI